MNYVLQNQNESDRLEKQAKLKNYSVEDELNGIKFSSGEKVLDAGCGTGVVSRFIAEKYPDLNVIGCDFGEDRLQEAKKNASHLRNIEFVQGDLTNLDFQDAQFDKIISRYVIQHVSNGNRQKAIDELVRCLKPGGELIIVDFDGTLHNIYPRTELMDKTLNSIEAEMFVDLRIGRKLPKIFANSELSNIQHEIVTMNFTKQSLEEEIQQMDDRLQNAMPYLTQVTGGQDLATQFKREFLETLNSTGTTYFYNKFIVRGIKPHLKIIK